MPTTDTRHSTKSVDNGGLHGTVSILYANAADRGSDTREAGYLEVLVTSDIGRFARQSDDESLWLLTSVGPPVWSSTVGGSGESNTASNLAAEGLFSAKSGVDLEFKGIAATSPLTISSSATQVTIALNDAEYIQRNGSVTFSGSQSHGNNDLTSIKTATFNAEIDNGLSGAALSIDWTSGQKQRLELDASTTLTFTDPAGPCNLMLKLTQDVTGSRSATWPASVKWSKGSAPNLTNAGGSIDLVSLYFDGVDYFGAFADDFS